MSNFTNENLFTRAAEMVDLYEGTPVARAIELNLHMNDLDGLRENVAKAEAIASQEEHEAGDVY